MNHRFTEEIFMSDLYHAEPNELSPRPDNEPEMSEISTLGNIFLEPGRTFDALRNKPRFIIAGIIISLLVGIYSAALTAKIGETNLRNYVSEQIDKRFPDLPADQKQTSIDGQMKVASIVRYLVPLFVFISLFFGGLLYWGASKAFGGDGGFVHNVSVWVYSSFPPTVVAMAANFVVLAFKDADSINLETSQRGLINAYTNLAFLIDGKNLPVLATVISSFDIFFIWGWILAAIGLKRTDKLSSGSAWMVVVIIALIGVMSRVIGAFISGSPN
ncbi:MAG: YIP1 family protein [Chloracidobacterium sp.]|nr:YIP1 family protein [Chloracidobacterium sp.]MCO5334826.1 YIP1 family protein [Pyrinomonadaceae bacterium]